MFFITWWLNGHAVTTKPLVVKFEEEDMGKRSFSEQYTSAHLNVYTIVLSL
jgi:hypothetical protein